jgi:hypothetical protein
VLDKKQALATMEVHIIRVESERRRRAERRAGRLSALYPLLRSAPLDAREDLLSEASRVALRSWPAVVLALATLALLIVPFSEASRVITQLSARALATVLLILMSLSGLLIYLRIRTRLRVIIGVRYKSDRGSDSASGA